MQFCVDSNHMSHWNLSVTVHNKTSIKSQVRIFRYKPQKVASGQNIGFELKLL